MKCDEIGEQEMKRQLVNRYAWVLSMARERARELGYALAVHGSEARDLDLIAAPWTDEAVSAGELAHEIAIATNGRILIPTDPMQKPHGRLAWSIQFDGPPWTSSGPPFIDLSVMPLAVAAELTPKPAVSGELKPCPFCGGEAAGMRIDRPLPNGMMDTLYQIACNTRECGASTLEWFPKESAARAWNRREKP